EHIEARGTDLVDKVRERLEQDVQERLGAAVETAGQALEVLGQALRGAAARTGAVRETVEAGLSAVEEAMEPLPGGIDQVKQAARQVGLEFA
ncbi:MAG TPA: hypothetical protein VFO85_19650, partial [Vicinamibacteria bacterium]|nr:hypothetical protein [Vicinamibacteria bacterium]